MHVIWTSRDRIANLHPNLAALHALRFRAARRRRLIHIVDCVTQALARAGCLATASEREGYGLVVVEAAARGTPSVIVAGPENAATELVTDGVNGAIAASAEPDDLADAILQVLEAGSTLRTSTARWFEENAPRLRLEESLKLVVREYEGAKAEDALQPHGV